jgi:diguanylate cyclase (GGDEF)-like protein/PAS domain S-box-containing protein
LRRQVDDASEAEARHRTAAVELGHLRALLESTSDAICAIDDRGVVTSWNRAAERLFGYPGGDAVGRTATGLFAAVDGAHEMLSRVAAGEPIVRADVHAVRRDGQIVPVALTATPLEDGDGAVLLVQDLTERELAQTTLAESQARLDELQSLAHVGLWIWDAGSGAVQWSEELHNICGIDPIEFDGTLEGHLGGVHEDDRGRVRGALNEALAHNLPLEIEYAVARPSGERRYVYARGGVVHDGAGRPAGVRGICLDLTEQKQAEQAAARHASLVGLLNRITAAANEAGSVEHALRSCVNEVRTHTEWPLGHVLLTSPGGDRVFSSGIWSLEREREQEFRRFRVASEVMSVARGENLPGRVLVDANPVWIPDVRAEPSFHRAEWAASSGIKAALAFPVVVGTEVVAVVELFDTEVRPCEDPLLAVLAACGNQVGRVVERTRAAEALSHQALHDPLTGLPNRALFVDRLEHAVAGLGRTQGLIAVLFLDLDGFKFVNDSLGHDVGDVVLATVAERLQRSLRPTDTIARFGGDEFTILCESIQNEEEAVQLAERIAVTLGEPVELEIGGELDLTTSIGIAFARSPRERPETLLRDADAAMYRAKEQGRARHEVFDSTMHQEVAQRLQLATDLRRALPRRELLLHYQPQVSLADGRIVGVEALVRWQHPTRGLLGPVHFIPVAEESQLIVPLGGWVLEEACRQVARWREDAPEIALKVCVNVSARQLGRAELIEGIDRVLVDTGLDPASLCVEITETVIMGDAAFYLEALLGLKVLGVSLAIDDFGVGYSSLAYLQRFPIDMLKIDKTFVDGLGHPSAQANAIVSAAIVMAHALGLEAVAEGVETWPQAAALTELGCDMAQGYYFARPMPPEEITPLLARGTLP